MTTLRIPEQRDFHSRPHHPRVASRIGICFFVCFVTGVLSHLAQDPNSWLPSRPTPYGSRADNATLLDRDYPAGWLVVAALTLLAVVVGVLVSDRRGGRRTGGPGAGGR